MYQSYHVGAAQDTREDLLPAYPSLSLEACTCGSVCLSMWSNKSIRLADNQIEIFQGSQFVIRCLLCNFAGPECLSDLLAVIGWNHLPRAVNTVDEEVLDIPF